MSLVVNNLACIRNDRVLFHGLNFSLKSGEVLHVQGANGVGKSSLLRILCGLLEPAKGEIFWRGELTHSDPLRFRKDLGYLGHKVGLKDRLSALENVQLFENFSSDSGLSQTKMDAEMALDRLGVLALKNTLCDTLSAGQKQRVALARLLVRNVSLWLLDEPFNAIDSAGLAALEAVLREQVEKGGIVIMTSHQPIVIPGLLVQSMKL